MSVLRTTGINYETRPAVVAQRDGRVLTPLTPAAIPNTTSISTLHLDMQLSTTFQGIPIELAAASGTCGSGCRGGLVALGETEVPVEILRFAKGSESPLKLPGLLGFLLPVRRLLTRAIYRLGSSSERPAGLRWLVTMEDGHNLRGSVSANVIEALQPARVGRLTLGGRMIVTYQSEIDLSPIRLFSRKEPRLEGEVRAWPPKGSSLQLTNGPIEYYREEQLNDPTAAPVLVVQRNSITFANEEVTLLTQYPEIQTAKILSQDGGKWVNGPIGGVEVTWNDTRARVASTEPKVAFYHVYRLFEGDTINGWMLAKIVPSSTQTWRDEAFDGKVAAYYVVLQAAEYFFGYHYESLVGTPVKVPSRAELESSST